MPLTVRRGDVSNLLLLTWNCSLYLLNIYVAEREEYIRIELRGSSAVGKVELKMILNIYEPVTSLTPESSTADSALQASRFETKVNDF